VGRRACAPRPRRLTCASGSGETQEVAPAKQHFTSPQRKCRPADRGDSGRAERHPLPRSNGEIGAEAISLRVTDGPSLRPRCGKEGPHPAAGRRLLSPVDTIR
jgi:hypothetical protein